MNQRNDEKSFDLLVKESRGLLMNGCAAVEFIPARNNIKTSEYSSEL